MKKRSDQIVKKCRKLVKKTGPGVYPEPRDSTALDVGKLQNELYVQQCEIDSLIDELRFAHQSQKESSIRYNALYDMAPVGYIVVDRNGTIKNLNRTAEIMTGYQGNLLAGTGFFFLKAGEKSSFLGFLQQIYAGKRESGKSASFTLRKKDSLLVPIQINASRISDDPYGDCLLAITDISEQAGLQSALSMSRDSAEHKASELNAVFNAITDVLFVCNRKGMLLKVNDAAVNVLGINPGAKNNLAKIIRRMSVRTLDGKRAALDKLPSFVAIRVGGVHQGRFIVTDARGNDRIIQATSSALVEKGLTMGAVTVWHDVTEREHLLEEIRKSRDELDVRVIERTAEIERSQAELRRLAKHLQTAREEERTNLAREIHDELGQTLAVLKFGLHKTLRKVQEKDGALAQDMKADLHLLKGIIDKVRNIFTELRPTMLDTVGFSAAVTWLAGEFEKKTGIRCNISVEDCQVQSDTGLALYRVIQEGLTNVARHAGASEVDIHCSRKNRYLNLTIADNGKGMKKDASGKTSSYGLLGMRERVLALGGTMNITGRKGKGTTLSVDLHM
jgi:PAS domain S-box-containing protein